MPKKKEIGAITNVDTERVLGLKWRPIMISRAVAELGQRFRKLLDRGKPQRLSFAVSVLNRMTVDLSWALVYYVELQDHSYLNGTVNTQNCRIWAKENPRNPTEISLQFP
ncbi:hypothetical protein TNCV_1188311 [Trichonephila clavipes]|nr:hypothetical protein TNCV_1188311 [Trichonephila clavipes]